MYLVLFQALVSIGCQTPNQHQETTQTRDREALIQRRHKHVVGHPFRRFILQQTQQLSTVQKLDVTMRLAKQACQTNALEDGLAILDAIKDTPRSPLQTKHYDHLRHQTCRTHLNRTLLRSLTCDRQQPQCKAILKTVFDVKHQAQTHLTLNPIFKAMILNPNIHVRTNLALKHLNQPELGMRLARWLIQDLWSQPINSSTVQNMYKLMWHPRGSKLLTPKQHQHFLTALFQLKDPHIKQTLVIRHAQQLIDSQSVKAAQKLLIRHDSQLERTAQRHRPTTRVLWSLFMAQGHWVKAEQMASLLDRDTIKNNTHSHITFKRALRAGQIKDARTILDRMKADEQTLKRQMMLVHKMYALNQPTMANSLWVELQKEYKATTQDEKLMWRLFKANATHAAGRHVEAKKEWKRLAYLLEIARLSKTNTETWNALINKIAQTKNAKLLRTTLTQFIHTYVPQDRTKRFKPLALRRFIEVETKHIDHPEAFFALWQQLHQTNRHVFLNSLNTKSKPMVKGIIQRILAHQNYSIDVLQQALFLCKDTTCAKKMLRYSAARLNHSTTPARFQRMAQYRLLAMLMEQSTQLNVRDKTIREWIATLPAEYRPYAWYKHLNLIHVSAFPSTMALSKLHDQTMNQIDQTGSRRLTKIILRHLVQSDRCDLAWKQYKRHEIKPDTTSWRWQSCTNPHHTFAKLSLITHSAPTSYRQLRWLLDAFSQKTGAWSWQHLSKALKPIASGRDHVRH